MIINSFDDKTEAIISPEKFYGKEEGCIAVEMECAGVQAVCDFRGLEYYNFLISGDLPLIK